MTPDEKTEYATLYERRATLQAAISARLAGGVQSATKSTGGNSESYTALPLSELRAELRAITARMRQLLGGVSSPWCYRDAPNFGR